MKLYQRHTITWPKLLICFALIFAINEAIGQQIIIHHHAYTTYYNPAKREPDSVSWRLTPAMVSCGHVIRINKFAQDPQIPNSATPEDYKHSGVDRGHLFSYESAMCNDTDRVECFFLSQMLPQIHSFNAGEWKDLEEQERKWAATDTLYIIAGSIGSIGMLKAGEVIPAYCYKAIYRQHAWHAWIMPNSVYAQGFPLDHWEVSIDELDKQTGLKL